MTKKNDAKKQIDEQIRSNYIQSLPAWLQRFAQRLGDVSLEDLKEAVGGTTKRARAKKAKRASGSAKKRARALKKAQRRQGAKTRAGKHSKAPK